MNSGLSYIITTALIIRGQNFFFLQISWITYLLLTFAFGHFKYGLYVGIWIVLCLKFCYFYKGHLNWNCNFVLFLWTEKEKNESKNQITRNLINLQKFDLKGIMVWPIDILPRNFCRRLSDNPDNPVCHKPIYCLEKKEKTDVFKVYFT